MEPSISSQIQSEVNTLGPDDQLRVLEFVRSIHGKKNESRLPQGMPGPEFAKLVGGLIPPEDLKEIAEAIDEGCEKVDLDEW